MALQEGDEALEMQAVTLGLGWASLGRRDERQEGEKGSFDDPLADALTTQNNKVGQMMTK